MSMNIGSNKSIDRVYAVIEDTNKGVKKTSDTGDNSKSNALTQDIGTDTFVKSEEEPVNSTYKWVKKKLTPEEIKALKEEQQSLKSDLIEKFISDTINSQNKLLGKSVGDESKGIPQKTADLLTEIFGSVENAYPSIATTKEGAEAAIAEGGAYSVDAVADRIMKMAEFIAGDDPDKLQDMREAVETGFSQAGMEFKNATESDLPQICKDTIAEVMKRFDELQNKTNEVK